MIDENVVSTHSRPKAAGKQWSRCLELLKSFNTQPPEGGWLRSQEYPPVQSVSTHSRPKAAGFGLAVDTIGGVVSTHSRPKAAGDRLAHCPAGKLVSTHSRPKAAGRAGELPRQLQPAVSTHSRPKAAGIPFNQYSRSQAWFQHTAARRRLVRAEQLFESRLRFQHTAARRRLGPTNRPRSVAMPCFNTQPPEGGWKNRLARHRRQRRFNTQPPEGGWIRN